MTTSPRVTIGLPVYNGERYLEQCLAALLGQSFNDFQIVISDNASTDRTAEICRAAAADSRIRYFRQPANVGAMPNFNWTLERATGEFFKWAAHDDLVAPDYLAKCIAALEADPDAVLCQSLAQMMDDQGELLEPVPPMGLEMQSTRPSVRFGGRMRSSSCVEIFGVIRRKVPAAWSMKQASYIGGDRIFLAELALRGRFVQLGERLFFNRDHPSRSSRITRAGGRKELATWYEAGAIHRPVDFPTWAAHRDYVRSIRRCVPRRGERLACYRHILASLHRRHTGAFLVLEPLMAVDPRVLSWAKLLSRATLPRASSGT